MRFAAIFLLFLVFIGSGCRTSGRKSSAETPADDASGTCGQRRASKDSPIAGTTAESTPAKYKKLDFSSGSVPGDFAYEGRITDGARWIDSNGENTLLVTERKQVRGQDDSVHFIYGYLYAIEDGSTRLLLEDTG